MTIPVEIVGLNQEYSFVDGEIVNYLVIALDEDRFIRAAISDEDTQAVIAHFTEVLSGTDEDYQAPPEEAKQQVAWQNSMKFDGPGETQVFSMDNPVGNAQTMVPDQKPYNRIAEPVTPAKPKLRVMKNEAGYPVVHGLGGVDRGEIVDQDADLDEDGVGSI